MTKIFIINTTNVVHIGNLENKEVILYPKLQLIGTNNVR